MSRTITIGTRGSRLALWQADWARTQMNSRFPAQDFAVKIIKTSGDINADASLLAIGGMGAFTKELEHALLSGLIDIAVHSLKDLPTVVPAGLSLTAICQREDARDVLVLPESYKGPPLDINHLRARARLGTSSPRRIAQLSHLRKDISFVDLRGNLDTRLRKLDSGQCDGIVLAAAGLRRLGLDHRISCFIPVTEMIPAVGQAALGIETRADDELAIELASALDHEPTHQACAAERALLKSLGGGCQLPIAAHAIHDDSGLHLQGMVSSRDGAKVLVESGSGSAAAGAQLGLAVAEKLLQRGAGVLLA